MSTTVTISAADVNKLRQQTGAGMMDCKKALMEANGDFEKAIDYLRKKGAKVAANRSDRETKEGYVIARTNSENNKGYVIALNCETDFVAKNQDFVAFAENVLAAGINNGAKSIEDLSSLQVDGVTVSEKLLDMIGKIGEKLEFSAYHAVEAPFVVVYNHPGNKLASVLGFNKSDVANLAEIGKNVAMQIAAMNPVAIDKDDVDSKTLEREIEIGKEQARNEGKPEAMLEKIAQGKLNKFYMENTLLNQSYIKEDKKSVRQYLSDNDKELTVTVFKRVQIG